MGSTKMKEEGKVVKEEESAKPAESKHPDKRREEKKERRVEKKELRTIVRIINTDLDGELPLGRALRGIKGISHSISNAICNASGYGPKIKSGSLKEGDIAKIEDVIKNLGKFGVPAWNLNRRRDIESGEDMHLSGQDLDIAKRFDIQRLVDAKTYKGVRHMLGLPARGQRTRSSFRGGRVVGVIRKSVRIVQQEAGKEAKPEEKK
jgi:small subunit ribosomal protein S13